MKSSVYVSFFLIVTGLIGCNQKKEEMVTPFPALNEEMLKKDQLRSLYNEGEVLCEQMKLVNSKGDTVFLKEINKKTSLVVRYSVHACGDCISFINKCVLDNIVDKESVFLFMADVPVRDLHVMKQQLGLPNIYKVDSLPISFDAEMIPYVFVLDSTYHFSSFFIPRKEMPEQTNSYFDFIKNKL